MPYRPPTRVATSSRPYLSMVTQADPEFQAKKHREVEYQFTGRVFTADPYQRGANNRLSNTYSVGQPRGAADPVIAAALAPTVGNETPGLYEGIETGEWA